ncbi:MAG: AEC family transporter [Acutalibacter sp.]|jgi:predicted permease
MEDAWILLRQLVVMFLYVGVGWCLSRFRLVTRENSSALTNLLLYVILPCVIVKSFLREPTAESTGLLLWSLLLAVIALGLAMGVSALVFRRDPMGNFGSSFSNAGFMGIPLITAVLGEGAVFYIAGFVALLNILQWTYGQAILGDAKAGKPLGVVKNPLVIAFLLGLVLYFLPVSLPEILTDAVGTVAACNAPVAMVILGVLLGNSTPAQIFLSRQAWLVSLTRLLVIPLLTAVLLKVFPVVPQELKAAVLMAAAAPVGSNLAVYVQRQGGDSQAAAGIVCLSTILSIVTMPLVQMIL